MQEFPLGSDTAVKTILMALLPQLECLTFIQSARQMVRFKPGRDSTEALSSLTSVIRRLSSIPPSNWPFFQSLRNVAAGINSRPWSRHFHYSVKDAAPLLLPKSVNLRLNMIVYDCEDYSPEWEPRISSCKRLSIHSGMEMSIDSISGLLRAVQNIKHLVLGDRRSGLTTLDLPNTCWSTAENHWNIFM